jgi:hypothetical protein
MALPVNNWADFLKVVRQLKDPKAKEQFETIVIDTADIAWDYCEQYICNVNGVDAINKIPYGGGYAATSKEFDVRLRSIVQMDFGLVLISHSNDKVFTSETGVEYNKIVPTLPSRARLICGRMCDIIGYSRIVETEDQGNKTMLFLRGTPRFEAGSRFKYTPDYIDFSYDHLVSAIGDAIDQQAAEDSGKFFVDSKSTIHQENLPTLDFDGLMVEFQSVTGELVKKDASVYGPRITEIVERHLGKGRKASEMTRDQTELLDIIVYELKDLK